MRLGALLWEAVATVRAARVSSILVAVVVAGTCLAAILSVGQQAAAEARLAQQLSGPAARMVTVTVTGDGPGISAPAVAVLGGLAGSQSVLATALPRDAINGALGEGATPIAVVAVAGTLDEAVSITRGRLPGPGEAVLPEAMVATAGFAEPAGFLESADGDQWQIVGAFVAREPYGDLNKIALTVPAPTTSPAIHDVSFRQLRVVADDVTHVAAVQDATLAVVAAGPNGHQVTPAGALGASSQAATGALSGFGRSLLLLILAAGAVFVAAVVLSDVLIRRRDLGRRRTLGITQGALVGLVAARTALAAIAGALIGVSGGLCVVSLSGSPPFAFGMAVGLLATLTAVVAGVPPAVYAARRDPVEVMRTP